MKTSKEVKEFLSKIGKKGGSNLSPNKKEAILKNLKKAHLKRWPKYVKEATSDNPNAGGVCP